MKKRIAFSVALAIAVSVAALSAPADAKKTERLRCAKGWHFVPAHSDHDHWVRGQCVRDSTTPGR